VVELSEIEWELARNADLDQVIAQVRKSLGGGYTANVDALKAFLVAYINSHDECNQRQGVSINPIGSTEGGAKVLKVRWALPGGGRSGGLRLGFLAYCEERKIVLGYGRARRDSNDTTLLEALRIADVELGD